MKLMNKIKKISALALLLVAIFFNGQCYAELQADQTSLSLSRPLTFKRTYHVDSVGGNDSLDGLTPETAWKTVGKVNAMQFDSGNDQINGDGKYNGSNFKAGDAILFKRGGVWNEPLYLLSSGSSVEPVLFGAYGDGNKPMITGGECFSHICGSKIDWQIASGSIYRLKTGKNVGVVSENGTNMTFVPWTPGKDNSPKMSPSSFMFDYENKVLYLWTTNGDSPNNYLIKGAVQGTMLNVMNSEYFLVKDIVVNYSAETCIKTKNIKHALFENLDINTCGGLWNAGGKFYTGNGMTIAYNADDVSIINSNIHDVYDSAISPQTYYKSNLAIKNITIKNNDMYNAPHSVVEITNWANSSLIQCVIIENNKIHGGGKGFGGKYNTNKPYGGPGILITIGNDRKSTVSNIDINNNTIYENELDGIAVGLNSGPVNIFNNQIYNNIGSGIIVFDDKVPTITQANIRDNQISNNGDDILSSNNVVVNQKNNTSINNGVLVTSEQALKYFKK